MIADKERSAVNIENSKHGLFKELGKYEKSPFATMYDVVLAAACIGYRNNSRVKLDNAQKIFRWEDFPHRTHIPFVHALALAETGDDTVLLKRDDVLTIVEEYANGGINDLYDATITKPGNALPNLINLILEHGESRSDDE